MCGKASKYFAREARVGCLEAEVQRVSGQAQPLS